MKRKAYRVLNERKKRGNSRIFSEKYLLRKSGEIFNRIKDKKSIKQEAKRLGNMSLRIDLGGTPEVSFVVEVKNGRLKFIPGKKYTDIAVGIKKEYFIQLINNTPQCGNMKNILFDKIFLKKGPLREFIRLKPIVIEALLGSI